MGNLSKQARMDLLNSQIDAIDKIISMMDKLTGIMIKDGLWIMAAVDMFAVSGRLRLSGQKGDVVPEFLIQQRTMIYQTIKTLTTKDLFSFDIDIGPFNIEDIDIPNPISYMTMWLQPLLVSLRATEEIPNDRGGTDTFFKALPPFERAVLVIMMPAIMRMMVDVAQGLLGSINPV